jgi:hypothetical protein
MHRIYMSFFLRGGFWICRFLEQDLKTSIGRGRTFGSTDKVRELVDRTRTPLDLAGHQALEHALNQGRGGLYLNLTEAQYRKLRS